jgi:hypothetical protein
MTVRMLHNTEPEGFGHRSPAECGVTGGGGAHCGRRGGRSCAAGRRGNGRAAARGCAPGLGGADDAHRRPGWLLRLMHARIWAQLHFGQSQSPVAKETTDPKCIIAWCLLCWMQHCMNCLTAEIWMYRHRVWLYRDIRWFYNVKPTIVKPPNCKVFPVTSACDGSSCWARDQARAEAGATLTQC